MMTENSSSPNWVTALLVALFGAIGGFTTCVYSLAVGLPMDLSDAKAVLSSIFLGLVAGFVGIFVLIRDPSRAILHTLGLALLCGFSWKPTLEAGKELVLTHLQAREVKTMRQQIEKQIELLYASDEVTAPLAIGQLASSSRELLNAAMRLRNPALRDQIEGTLKESVAVLDEMAEVAPEESARALGSIGAAAMIADQPSISAAASRSLLSLAEKKDSDLGASLEVSNSLIRLAAASTAEENDDEARRLRERSIDLLQRAERLARPGGREALEEVQKRSLIRRERQPSR